MARIATPPVLDITADASAKSNVRGLPKLGLETGCAGSNSPTPRRRPCGNQVRATLHQKNAGLWLPEGCRPVSSNCPSLTRTYAQGSASTTLVCEHCLAQAGPQLVQGWLFDYGRGLVLACSFDGTSFQMAPDFPTTSPSPCKSPPNHLTSLPFRPTQYPLRLHLSAAA